MAYYQDMPWHDGEIKMQQLMKVPNLDNPTVPALSPQLANHLKVAPLIAIGTLDKQGRPWTTLWGGEKGLARSLGSGVAGIRTPVTGRFDPVVEELVGKEATGEVVKEAGEGRMVSGLTIDLETRKRTKLYGRMIAGALSGREDEITGSEETVAEIQLVLKIEQSLGNCPKYLNRKHIVPTFTRPELISDGPHLPQRALDLIAKADLFFLSSSRPDQDMDTNHRGGPPGFLRVVSAGSESTSKPASIAWPEQYYVTHVSVLQGRLQLWRVTSAQHDGAANVERWKYFKSTDDWLQERVECERMQVAGYDEESDADADVEGSDAGSLHADSPAPSERSASATPAPNPVRAVTMSPTPAVTDHVAAQPLVAAQHDTSIPTRSALDVDRIIADTDFLAAQRQRLSQIRTDVTQYRMGMYRRSSLYSSNGRSSNTSQGSATASPPAPVLSRGTNTEAPQIEPVTVQRRAAREIPNRRRRSASVVSMSSEATAWPSDPDSDDDDQA
ncbi:hypothetical protein LTR12_013364 [Friedmanniomyces endolithicus]|nr:hypothetical protein LTR12_013364 [Friedmanniomyces endolithicus]